MGSVKTSTAASLGGSLKSVYTRIIPFFIRPHQLLRSHDLNSCSRNHNVIPGYEVKLDKLLFLHKDSNLFLIKETYMRRKEGGHQ